MNLLEHASVTTYCNYCKGPALTEHHPFPHEITAVTIDDLEANPILTLCPDGYPIIEGLCDAIELLYSIAPNFYYVLAPCGCAEHLVCSMSGVDECRAYTANLKDDAGMNVDEGQVPVLPPDRKRILDRLRAENPFVWSLWHYALDDPHNADKPAKSMRKRAYIAILTARPDFYGKWKNIINKLSEKSNISPEQAAFVKKSDEQLTYIWAQVQDSIDDLKSNSWACKKRRIKLCYGITDEEEAKKIVTGLFELKKKRPYG
jgi:hypothetical protein